MFVGYRRVTLLEAYRPTHAPHMQVPPEYFELAHGSVQMQSECFKFVVVFWAGELF